MFSPVNHSAYFVGPLNDSSASLLAFNAALLLAFALLQLAFKSEVFANGIAKVILER